MKKILFIIVLFIFQLLPAQNRFNLKGLILNNQNKPLEAVNIFIKNQPHLGTTTDDKGYFEIQIPQGKHTLVIAYLGYQKKEMPIDMQKNKYIVIHLKSQNTELNQLVISVKESSQKEIKKLIGLQHLSIKQIQQVPMLFGELDVLKAVQVLPGVKAVSEGSAGFSVHGGSQDQNLILLDGAPIYHPSHILGFFSVFTPDIIKNLKLYKSSIPAKFGNRLSSILEVNTRTGNIENYHFGGGFGLIASQLYAEGPISKNKSSFLVSARKSYGDIWLPLLNIDEVKDVKAGFYDFNLKLNFKLSEKNQLKISAYTGRDDYRPDKDFKMDYGNMAGSIALKHRFNQKWVSQTKLIYSKYDYLISLKDFIDIDYYDFRLGMSIESPNLKQDFSYYINAKNQVNFGIDAYYHMIKPGDIKNNRAEAQATEYPDRQAAELDLYAQHQYRINPKLKLIYGFRWSNFSQLGTGDFYQYNSYGEVTDTIVPDAMNRVKTYSKLAPRMAVNWHPRKNTAVKLSYDRTYQFLHYLINDASTTTPTDLWLPSSINLKPQQSDAYNLALHQQLGKSFYLSIGGYYRDIKNVTEYKIGAALSLASDIERDLIQEQGRAYGLEFLIKKQTGKLTGSLAYTYSKSEKQHPDINEGLWYPAAVDRPHDINLLLNYKISDRANISAMWQYYSGRPITYPAGTYQIDTHVILFFSHRNANRLPDYHRMDLSFTWHNKKYIMADGRKIKRKWQSYWNFSIYNAYAHENTFMVKFKYDEQNKTIEAYRVTLFKMIPSISYHFKF